MNTDLNQKLKQYQENYATRKNNNLFLQYKDE